MKPPLLNLEHRANVGEGTSSLRNKSSVLYDMLFHVVCKLHCSKELNSYRPCSSLYECSDTLVPEGGLTSIRCLRLIPTTRLEHNIPLARIQKCPPASSYTVEGLGKASYHRSCSLLTSMYFLRSSWLIFVSAFSVDRQLEHKSEKRGRSRIGRSGLAQSLTPHFQRKQIRYIPV
jgi:hypothetical protein